MRGKYAGFLRGKFSQTVSYGLQTSGRSGILLQRGIVIFDCEAAALPGRFLPELGRSSERPFFFAGLLGPEFVARSLMGLKPTSLPRSCSGPKIPREKLSHVHAIDCGGALI